MAVNLLTPLLAAGAGALTILSPCVLPLVPVVLSSAAQRNRYGPVALATGLIAGFTVIGFAVAAFGSKLGVDPQRVRFVGAGILAAAGVFLLAPRLQDRLAYAAGPLMTWAGQRQAYFDDQGLWGQFAIGALLGAVWSPCVGPTLGAAIALAAQGQQLTEVAITMGAFAVGITFVLLAIAFAGRAVFNRSKSKVAARAKRGKLILGAILLGVAVFILTGLDRQLEAILVSAAPDWLVQLTTSI
jgi:cytochrome c biogenesis protein CcdA